MTRFANEYGCDVEQTTIQTLGAQAFRVTGCGRSATYVCLVNLYNEGICTLDQADGRAAAGSAHTSGGEQPASFASRPPPTRERVVIDGVEVPAVRVDLIGARVTIAPDPRVPSLRVAAVPGDSADAGRCTAFQLSTAAISVAGDPEIGPVPMYRLNVDAFRAVLAANTVHLSACGRTALLSDAELAALRELLPPR